MKKIADKSLARNDGPTSVVPVIIQLLNAWCNLFVDQRCGVDFSGTALRSLPKQLLQTEPVDSI
jgi:hypothetical protein